MSDKSDSFVLTLGQKQGMIRLLAFGFFFVFLPFHAVERYVAVYYEQASSASVGFQILAVAYLSLFAGDFCSPLITARLGYRKSLMLASSFYFLWILSLVTQSFWLIYPASVLAGFAAALLWNSMATCVILEGEEEALGANFGKILSFYGVGAGVGLVLISILLSMLETRIAFMVLAPVALVGTFVFRFVPKMKKPPPVLPGDLFATYFNWTILRLASISMMAFLAFGLLVSVIPLHIEKVLGHQYIGWLSSGAFFVLFLCYFFGKLMDKIGTKGLILIAYPSLAGGAAILIFSDAKLAIVVGVLAVCLAFAILFVVMLGLADLAPEHKVASAQAVFTSADDITAFAMLAASSWFVAKGISLSYLYWFTLVSVFLSFLAIFPLFKGSDLSGAQERLVKEFPAPQEVEADIA